MRETLESLRARAEKAEAEATRLRGMWDGLKARVGDATTETFRHRYLDDGVAYTPYRVVAGWLAELEATPSGPAEEGR